MCLWSGCVTGQAVEKVSTTQPISTPIPFTHYHYIQVEFNLGVPEDTQRKILGQFGFCVKKETEPSIGGYYFLYFSYDKSVDQVIQSLKSNPEIKDAWPDDGFQFE